MKKMVTKFYVKEKFMECGIYIFSNTVYNVINEIIADDRKKVANALRFVGMQEKEDFLKENNKLSDFQQGVLYGIKLASIKVENYAKEGINDD